MSRIIDNIEIYNESKGLIVQGKCLTTDIPTTSNRFAIGCSILGADGKNYRNAGTIDSPVWQDTDEIETSEIASGAVTLAKLATAVAPSDVIKFVKSGSDITTTALEGLEVGDLVLQFVAADDTVVAAPCAVADTLPNDPADADYIVVLRTTA